ncbi:19660_t:CDS:2 [Rhizophagus irregularis]|nr:19660_t:CDS:2 [Rhizophagus irregularis]
MIGTFEPPIAPIAAPKLLLKKLPKEMNLLQCPTPNPNPYIIADKIIGATNAPTNPIAMFQ